MKESIALCGYYAKTRLRHRYVSALPGDGGVDWEWTEDRKKALALTPYWQRRFAKYARHLELDWWFCSPVGEYNAQECSICRGTHGPEVIHACE